MSRRRILEDQITSLAEIREIMSAMKNLSLMEVHRLTRLLDTQHKVAASIESAAADFLTFHPELSAPAVKYQDILLLIGTERGFCGNFNQALIRSLAANGDSRSQYPLLVIGRKLGLLLESGRHMPSRDFTTIEGPTVVEEVQPVLEKLVQALNAQIAGERSGWPLRLTIIHQVPGADVQTTVLEPFERKRAAKSFPYPPLLYTKPQNFLTALGEQYLFATLHGIIVNSLMAENQRRMQHMDSAVQRLEERTSDLQRACNSLRQEEITEEIEVILLSVEALRKS